MGIFHDDLIGSRLEICEFDVMKKKNVIKNCWKRCEKTYVYIYIYLYIHCLRLAWLREVQSDVRRKTHGSEIAWNLSSPITCRLVSIVTPKNEGVLGYPVVRYGLIWHCSHVMTTWAVPYLGAMECARTFVRHVAGGRTSHGSGGRKAAKTPANKMKTDVLFGDQNWWVMYSMVVNCHQ